ncbi:ATPase, T2SS/T4P/T4SS family [Brucella intermedia]|uniref:ATPase, T2SS/T4P/T4SS family n=1 Tax=Brucella intermedia TaxID=94625 RepID=UPI0023614951|nr:ATPase, T2SS/T4P/T4SS family [Brucella intermedia]
MDYLHEQLKPLSEFLRDPSTVEIAVNPDNSVWILRRGDVSMQRAALIFRKGQAHKLIELIAGKAHAKTSDKKLLVSASINFENRLVRAQGLLPPAVQGEAALSLRLFASINIDQINLSYLHGRSHSISARHEEILADLDQLIESGDLINTLSFCVTNRLNVLIAGGTDTGKTVALRKILSLIDPTDRLITIEDAEELLPTQPNTVPMIADRHSDTRTTDRLLEASLRMRPDRIIVGEIRGKEAMTFLEAINTGHGGSMSTIHAETPDLALDRLAIAAARADVPMTYDNLRAYIHRTIDVIVQAGRHGSQRGIAEIYRVRGKH